MGNKEQKKINWVAIACGFILVLQAAASFPSIRIEGRTIRLFAFEGMFRGDGYHGRVLGNHVLESEYGQIRLGHGTSLLVRGNFVRIYVENFIEGRASHNLVVEGIEMPPNITFSFFFNPIRLSFLQLDGQEIVVSGVPLVVGGFDLTHLRNTVDIVMEISSAPEYIITLADSTQIYINEQSWGWGGLRMYKDTGIWVLTEVFSGTPVRLPGETEFARYRSITFRPDWGEFIEGELFE